MPANTNWWALAGAAIQVGGGIAFKDNMGRIGTSVAAGFVTSGFSPYGVKDSAVAGGVAMNNVGEIRLGLEQAGIGAPKD